jgi:glucose-6-phosphate isomerase
MNDIVIDYTNVMADAVGADNGIAEEALTALGLRAKEIQARLQDKWETGKLPFYDLPTKLDDAKAIKRAAASLQKNFKNMVVLGIGGSALGTAALLSALKSHTHNSLSDKKRGGMRLFIADNIDPDWFTDLLTGVKLKETVFNVISKSGSTAETMSQFMIVVDILKSKLGKEWKKHLVITTDAAAGTLRPIADKQKIKSFIVPDGVGGRFTVFTPVSLLPAACAGIDIVKLLNGAARMRERIVSDKITENPAALFSAIHYLLDTSKGKKMTVMMPYANGLYTIADWFRQMWAESLGKKEDIHGNPIHCGQTPIKALGATDQHSQVQLYVEGPFDKVVVFIEVEKFKNSVTIPGGYDEHASIGYLSGSSLAALTAVEKEGTEYALTANHRPNMTIRLPEICEETVGQLLYLLEGATAFSGGLYNIDPFDQPGVEFGKQYAYAMMGKAGFEEKKAAYERAKPESRRTL